MGFLVVLLFCLSLISVTVGNFDIDFPQLEFGERKVDLKGDAMFVHNNPVELVCHGRHDAKVKASYGGILYNTPYKLWLMNENRSSSFLSEFVIEIVVPTSSNKPTDLGNGFAFFLSPEHELVRSPFAFPSKSFSIAFDNRIDPSNPIPTDTYVSVFRDSLFPNITTTMDFNLHIAQKIKVLIVYKGDKQNLLVFVKDVVDNYKFPSLVFNHSVDLGAYMLDHGGPMFIGISAVSKTCAETYKFDSWKFRVEKPQIQPRRRTSSLVIVLGVIGTIVFAGFVIFMLCRIYVMRRFPNGVGVLVMNRLGHLNIY